MTTSTIITALLFVVGIVCLVFTTKYGFLLERKAFERTNAAGVEVHKNYDTFCKTRFKEGGIKLFAYFLGYVGVFSLIIAVIRCFY